MMTATLRNWGGSVALPIPKTLLSLAHLEVENEVTLDLRNGQIAITASRPKFTLKQLQQEHKALALQRDAAWLDFDDLPSERV